MQKGDKVIIENLFIHADLSYINRRRKDLGEDRERASKWD